MQKWRHIQVQDEHVSKIRQPSDVFEERTVRMAVATVVNSVSEKNVTLAIIGVQIEDPKGPCNEELRNILCYIYVSSKYIVI